MTLSFEEIKKEQVLTEWKTGIDLHKWHEDLKQSRLRNFITIQTSLIAGWAFVTYQIFSVPRLSFLLLSTAIASLGFFQSVGTFLMDRRAALYVQEVKSHLRRLESRWNTIYVGAALQTYTMQDKKFSIPTNPLSFKKRLATVPASKIDSFLITCLIGIWSLAVVSTLAVFCRYRWGWL